MAETEQPKKLKSFAEFLESTPPYTLEEISDLCDESERPSPMGKICLVASPEISLHCETCEGPRFFSLNEPVQLVADSVKYCFLHFTCRNCGEGVKAFAVALRRTNTSAGMAVKYGEDPQFGPHTPARVITLIGPDRDIFLKGRRAENQGFGIGSFAYYRRVVENQKGRIIREIAKASAKLGASKEMLSELERAQNETQFSKAIEQVKHGIPAALLIHEHNPLTLLHTALSEGLHEHTDEECLEIAQEIRLVLTELAERISQALKEEAELKQAVTRLMSRRKKSESGSAAE
jgi:hypothetical protein